MNSQEIKTLYKNHVLLSGKMAGETKALRGNVVTVVFFINDSTSSWDEKSKATYRKRHESAIKNYNQLNLANYQAYYKKYYYCNEAPVIFAFNKQFRSYACAASVWCS